MSLYDYGLVVMGVDYRMLSLLQLVYKIGSSNPVNDKVINTHRPVPMGYMKSLGVRSDNPKSTLSVT